MKFTVFIFVSCIVLTLTHGKYEQEELKFMEECMKREKVELKIGQPFNKDDPNIGCVAACVMEKTGKIGDNGDIDIEKFPKDMQEMAKACVTVTTGDRCTKAAAFFKCIYDSVDGINDAAIEDCARETDTKIDFKYDMDGIWQDDKKACFNRCLMIKAKTIDENNNFIIPQNMKGKGLEISQKCKDDNQQEDKCIQAVARMNCIVQTAKYQV